MNISTDHGPKPLIERRSACASSSGMSLGRRQVPFRIEAVSTRPCPHRGAVALSNYVRWIRSIGAVQKRLMHELTDPQQVVVHPDE
jgi:hypothetical protein